MQRNTAKKWAMGLGAIAMVVGFGVTEAAAGPLACAKAIAGCGKGGVKSAKQIKETRSACEALRDCKKVCRVDKRDAKGDNKDEKQACISGCDGKKGKAKRSCKKACRKEKRGDNKGVRGDKQACTTQCREDYKTPACKGARGQLIKTLAVEGLKCAASVAAACPTATP